MPAITPGRSSTSQTGRVAGRRSQKTKKKVRAQQRRVVTQARTVKRTQAAHAREAQRKKTLARTAPGRQLGEGTRGRYEPKTDLRSTRIGTGGRYYPTDKESAALKAIVGGTTGAAKRFHKGIQKTVAQMAGSGGSGTSTPKVALAASVPKPGKKAGRTFNDFYQFPATTVTSAAAMADAALQYKKGNKEPAKKILRDLDQHDPVWNSALALGNAVRGDMKGAAKRFDQANKSIDEHPGLAALEFYSLKGISGRGITRGARATARTAAGAERITPGRAKAVPRKVKEKARKVGSTERAPARVPGTNLVEHRRYSTDYWSKRAQRGRDRYKADQARRRRGDALAARSRGEHERARELFVRANELDPEIISGKGILRAVDEHIDVTEKVRRRNRAIAERDATRTLKGTKKGGPITSLLTQRITTADLPALRKYRDQIRDEGAKLDPSEGAKIEANGVLVRELTEAIKNVEKGKVDLANLRRVADAYADRSQASQAELVKRGLVHPDEAERRAAGPFMVNELGARKEPQTLRAFAEAAQKESAKAKAKAKAAKGQRRELTGAQRVQRANEPSAQIKREVAAAAPNRAAAVQEWIKRVENMDPAQLKREIKREEARQRKAAKADKRVEQRKAEAKEAKRKASAASKRRDENPLVLPGGAPISTADALAAMERAHGSRKAAFVSQKPGQTKAGAHFIPADEAPTANTGAFSGTATREGTFDASPDALVTQAVRTQGIIDAFDAFQRMIGQMGLRDRGGDPVQRKTYNEARQDAADRSVEGQEWVPIRVNPLGATKDQLRAMVEGTSDAPVAQILRDAATAPRKGDESGPWTVVPKEVAEQMAKHMDKLNPGNTMRAMQQATSFFRRTVLSTSPTWFLGNIGEGAFRTAVHGAGPRSYLTGRRALKEARALDPEAAVVGEARTIGTGEASLTQSRQHHRDLSQYQDGTIKRVAKIAKAVMDARVKGTPISPRLLQQGWDLWTNATMNLVNKGIENQFQTALLGKAIRTERAGSGKRQIAHRPKPLMTARARALSSRAAREAAEGILNENTARALGREVDRMYGKYSKFSPDMRSAVILYTPFAAWMMNALKFVARMPEDNPATTAAIALAERASEDWRKEHGLAMFEENSAPAWLQGSIPDDKGGHYRAPTRYLPFSIGVDTPNTIASQVLPQWASMVKALQGQDWKGDTLKDGDGEPIPEGDPRLFLKAGEAFAKGTIPGLNQYLRARKDGAEKVFGVPALLQYTPPTEPKGGGGGGAPSDGWESSDDWEETDDWESGGWDESSGW